MEWGLSIGIMLAAQLMISLSLAVEETISQRHGALPRGGCAESNAQ